LRAVKLTTVHARARLSLSLVVLTALACTTVEYTPPGPGPAPPLEVEIDAPFARVWSRLESYVREQNFDIRKLERDLGQVEVAFGPVEPGTYADCGEIVVKSRKVDYDGPFTGYLRDHTQTQLLGEVSVRAHRSDAEHTRVTLGVKYVLTARVEKSTEGRKGDYSLLFNSTTPATVRERVPLTGKTVERTCRSNHVLEEAVIETLRSL
jgi:hypothetical protein